MTPSIVALIPARAGSKRCPGKNTRLLGGKPLIQWTIEAAKASGVFQSIIICSDDIGLLEQAYGWPVQPLSRPPVPDDQPDIAWVRDALERVEHADAFAILRPTSPFRTVETIRRAWDKFQTFQPADSLRAVMRVSEHPGKMWAVTRGERMVPLLPLYTRTGRRETDAPWHSAPTQTLPVYYVQTGGLEIAWTKTLQETDTIAGSNVIPYELTGYESADINTEDDFTRAEQIAASLVTA